MRLVIFGGSGFVGTNLLKSLDDSFEIFIPSRKVKETKSEKNINYVTFNIDENLSQIKPDIVINLIGILKETNNIDYKTAHIETVEKIIKGMLKNNIRKIIHISALGVGRGCNSNYFVTKEIAENRIINSPLEYLVIRPPIMIGDGQKLNDELKKLSKITPIIFAPKSKTRICSVEDTINEIIKGIYGKKGIVEIEGKTVRYKDLFEEILKKLDIKRIIIEIPPKMFFLPAILSFLFKNSPLTFDTYKMLICSEKIYE